MNKKSMSAIMLAGAITVGVVAPVISHASNIGGTNYQYVKKNVKTYNNSPAKVIVKEKRDVKRGNILISTNVQLKTKYGTFDVRPDQVSKFNLKNKNKQTVNINGESYMEYAYYKDPKGKSKYVKKKVLILTP